MLPGGPVAVFDRRNEAIRRVLAHRRRRSDEDNARSIAKKAASVSA